jgi:hypothetical protein
MREATRIFAAEGITAAQVRASIAAEGDATGVLAELAAELDELTGGAR